MAANYQEFVTEVKLNSEQARNKLQQLRKETEEWIKKRDDLISAKGSKTQINNLTKLIQKNERAMGQLEKQAHNIIDTLDNLDGATLSQLQQAEKTLNAEMRKTPQNTQYFHELTEKLQQVKTQIAAIRDETKSTFTEQQQLNEEMQNMNRVLGNLNTASLKELAMAEATLKRQMQEAVPNSPDYTKASDSLKQVQSRIKEVNAEQKEIVRTIDKYDEEIKNAHKDMATVNRETKLVGDTLKNLDKSTVRDIEYSIKILNENLKGTEQGTEEFKRMNSQLKELKTRLAAINEESKETQSRWMRTVNFFNRNWGVLTQGFAALTGLTMTVRKCVQSFADMEEAMADTRKYTGLTMDVVRELNEEFKNMDTRTSREELNELAGAAGRLGITSKDKIKEFVEAANMIKVSLGDDLGEGAIDQVGKLAMAFGEDDAHGLRDAMLKTGSAINELAQNSAAKAGYLVDFTARVGAFGKSLGLTQAQIMGFGAVMDENLLREEMSATAFGNMLTKMQTDTAKFAKIAGKDVKEFTKLIKEDANAAVLALADNLRKQDPSVMMKMLDDMGLDGARAVGVLSTLADKIDDVRKHQERATKAYEEGKSVIEEYDVMNNTVQAQLDKAKKGFHEIAIELGQKLQPLASKLITTGALAVKGLSALVDIITKNWRVLLVLTSGIIAYQVAVNKAIIMEKLHNALLVIRNTLHKIEAGLLAAKTVAMTAWGVVVDLVTGKITLATAVQELWNKVILANPYVAAAAAIMGLTAAILHFVSAEDQAQQVEKKVNEIKKEAKEKIQDEIEKINTLVDAANNERLSLEERKKAIDKLNNIIPDYNGKLDTTRGKYTANKKALDKYIDSLVRMYEVIGAKEKLQEIGRQKVDLQLQIAEQEQALKEARERAAQNVSSAQPQTSSGAMAPGSYHAAIGNSGEISAIEGQINRLNKKAEILDATSLRIKEIWGDDIQRITIEEPEQPEVDPHSGAGDYKTDAELKKEERARFAAQRKREAEERRKEAQRNKDFKEEMKAEKAHMDALLLENYLHFAQETHDLEAFRKKELEIRQASLDEQIAIAKKYHGEEASEVATLLKKKEELQTEYNKTTYKLKEEEIKHNETLAKMQAQRDFHTIGSEIYNDDAALQQRLSQIELTALKERMDIMKEQSLEGTAEYLRLQNEYTEKENQAKLDSEIYMLEKLDEYREQWGRMSNEKQMSIALQGLETLHKNGLIKEEEYQRMKMAIQAQYAKNPVEKRNEDFDAKVNDAVAVAKSKASGGYDKSQGMSMTNNPIMGEITQYKSVMEQLKILREQDKISYQEYQQAKADVTAEFLTNMVSQVQAAYDSINNVMSAASSFYAAQSQYEQNVTAKKYDKMIEKAGNNQVKQKKLEEKKQKELAKIKNKYNKKAMKIELAQAVASTALAAINSYASASKINWILGAVAAAMATAAGMLQIAAIKKQHAAEEAGYYEGGFTGGSSYRKKAGIVHQGEFVVNHDGVNNQNLMPILRLFDTAQRNNTIGSLTAADVSQQLGQGGAVVAPVVNVQNDNEELRQSIAGMNDSIERLNYHLDEPQPAVVSMEQLAREWDKWNKLKKNT